MNNVVIRSADLRRYYNKPISGEIKKLVDLSLAEGAKVVTFEVGCLLQLSHEGANISEIELLVNLIKDKCMRIYWANVRSFLILHIDPRYHDVVPL
ncbi:MAG: hypothetical protein WCI57_00565 [Candidatus Berkelbacteria bacterium]